MHDIIDRKPNEDDQGDGFGGSQSLAIKMHQCHDACDDNGYAENGHDTLDNVASGIKENQESKKDCDTNSLDGTLDKRLFCLDGGPKFHGLAKALHRLRRNSVPRLGKILPLFVFDHFFRSRCKAFELGFSYDLGENDLAISYSKVLSVEVFGTLIVLIFITDPLEEVGEESLLRCYREISLKDLFDVDFEIGHPTLC